MAPSFSAAALMTLSPRAPADSFGAFAIRVERPYPSTPARPVVTAFPRLSAMTPPQILTVVIPTRNRPGSLAQLLTSLASQTLSPSRFEVVVVDDGSDPPLDPASAAGELRFHVRLVRRTVQPGAHASREAGLRAASGERVLFLDDDVVLSPEVLAEHAGVEEGFAIGPILYHPATNTTPYYRYQTKLYADDARNAASQASRVPASEMYICNASGQTDRFGRLFDGVRAGVGGTAVPGDGFDEGLLNHQLRDSDELARFLPRAVALHVDTKSLEQARRERRLRGMTECRLLRTAPGLRASFGSYASLTGGLGSPRTWKARLFWMAPRPFRSIADALTFLADRGPARWVPRWACYLPMAVAFWDGVHAVAPSYRQLRESLLTGAEIE